MHMCCSCIGNQTLEAKHEVFCHNSECSLLKRIQLIEADPKENKLVATQLVRNQEVDSILV